MDILNKIIDTLKQKGYKQKDLTDYLGVGKALFTDWKSGRINSYMKYIPQIAEFLDVSTDYLLGISEDDNKKINSIEFAFGDMSDDDIEIMKKTKELSPQKKRALLNMIKALGDDFEDDD